MIYIFNLTKITGFHITLKALLEDPDISKPCFNERVLINNLKTINCNVVNTCELAIEENFNFNSEVSRRLGFSVPFLNRSLKWTDKRKFSKEKLDYLSKRIYATYLLSLSHDDVSSSDSCSSEDIVETVLLDSFHAMKRISDTIPKKHAFSHQFLLALRDAIFILDENDKRNVNQFLADQALDFQLTYDLNSNWICKRVKRKIPSKEILASNLKNLKSFNDAKYCSNGIPLLSQESLIEIDKLIVHADKGCLSDPIGVPLYFETGMDSNGLKTYRCIRGTSDVEGAVHQKITSIYLILIIELIQPWNAGPRYFDAILAIYRHRYNIRASQRHRPNFPTLGHYNHFIIDMIQVSFLFDSKETSAFVFGRTYLPYPWWPNTMMKLKSTEQFGVVPFLPLHLQEIVTDDEINEYTASIKYIHSPLILIRFLAKRTRSVIPYLPIRTKQEKQCFKVNLMNFYSNGKIDFIKMAMFWSDGHFNDFPLDGKTVFKKLTSHLERYHKRYLKSTEFHAASRICQQPRKALRRTYQSRYLFF